MSRRTPCRPRAILVASDAPAPTLHAAEELQQALARASGVTLPIALLRDAPGGDAAGGLSAADADQAPAFVVGTPPPGEGVPSAPDGCCRARRGERFYLWGQGPRGALYAVYGYLQDVLGFRWLTAAVELCPHLEELVLPEGEADAEDHPAFAVRDVGYFEAAQGLWPVRSRLNGSYAAGRLAPEWGGGVRYTHFVHTFYDLVPPERYFASHPEYFALVDGRRRQALAQLCLTNPAIVPIAADAVRSWFAADPQAAIASVSQNDWLGACECADCRALVEREGSQSGPVLHFVNAVARAVARDYPDRLIDTLAYWYTEDPPRHLRPEPNVAVRLCHMFPSCESHPLGACPANQPFVQRLQAWSRIAPRLHVWDYHTNFSHYLMPFPNFAAIAADLALLRRHGVESVFCQGNLAEGGGGEWAELRAYYLARLLWNPQLDAELLIEEFLRGVFPHAHRPLRRYWELVQGQAKRPDLHLRMFSPVHAGHLPPALLAEAAALLAEAGAMAADGSERLAVERVQLQLAYVQLAMPPVFRVEGEALVPQPSTAAAEGGVSPGSGSAPAVQPGATPPSGGGAGERAVTPAAPRVRGLLEPGEERLRALEGFCASLERQGIRQVREATPLEAFRRWARVLATPHAAPLWRAGAWRLRVVPALGGRLWEAWYGERQLLAPAEWSDGGYPVSRGYEESCAAGLGASAPFDLQEHTDGARLVLTATLEGMSAWHSYRAIHVQRLITAAADGGLVLQTIVRNSDDRPHPLGVRARLFLAGGAALQWCDAEGRWSAPVLPGRATEATVAPGGSDATAHVVGVGARGWRVVMDGQTLECRHGPCDRLEAEARPWGWRIELVGVETPVDPGQSAALEQHWRMLPANGSAAE